MPVAIKEQSIILLGSQRLRLLLHVEHLALDRLDHGARFSQAIAVPCDHLCHALHLRLQGREGRSQLWHRHQHFLQLIETSRRFRSLLLQRSKYPVQGLSVCGRHVGCPLRQSDLIVPSLSLVASPRLLSGVAVVMQGPMPTFTRVLEQHENGEQAPRRRVAGLFIVS